MLPLEERPAWLAALPPRFDLLREPLKRLLEVQAGIQTRPFLDAFTGGTEGLSPPAPVIVGDLIGPYRLLQQLGDGGMGSVWLAERADGTLKRRVALKLPRMVWARDLAARMARERDILGSLEHPNIATLYDAGVDQLGRPFLALEYVEGQRIDRFCDEQLLSVHARVRLFIQVLDAAQYAHVNLVLHRDLKPGNVLVNQRGEVRLLDFGIAKLMSDDEQVSPIDPNSRTLARAMTPRYASPEQVQHQRLTLASDVYSLGVMLYELLVGSQPYVTHNASRAELETAILESRIKTPSRVKVEPPVAECRAATASRLSQILRGDIDAVLLKAMARSVSERYPSVEAFRLDLVRWLEGHPVLAKPPSRLVAIKKFVARNVVAVSVVGLAASAVIISAIIAMLQAHEARVESRRAAATRDFLIGLFEKANPELHGGRDVSAREVLQTAELSLEKSEGLDEEIKSELYATAGRLWTSLGDLNRAREATYRRLDALNKIEEKSLIAAALFDFAEIAVQSKNNSDLVSAVNQLSSLTKDYLLSPLQKSDYFWYSGWRDLQFRSYDSASKNFSLSREIASKTQDIDRSLRSIYGQMLVSVFSGKGGDAISIYREAKIYLLSIEQPPSTRLRRELELVSGLYHLGEYSFGWALVDRLIEESKRLHGEFNSSQVDLYQIWGAWSIRVGRSKEFLDWLEFQRQNSKNKKDGLDPSRHAQLALLEIEAFIELSRIEEALNSIKNIEQGEFLRSRDQRLTLSVLKVTALLQRNETFGAARELSRPLWITEGAQLNDHWAIYFYWLQGIQLVKEGQSALAISKFNLSEKRARQLWGDAHPRTVMIEFNGVLADFWNKPRTEQTIGQISNLRLIVERLGSRLPDESPVMIRARGVVERLERNYRVGEPSTEGLSMREAFLH
jgi:serine/threonine protein kinase